MPPSPPGFPRCGNYNGKGLVSILNPEDMDSVYPIINGSRQKDELDDVDIESRTNMISTLGKWWPFVGGAHPYVASAASINSSYFSILLCIVISFLVIEWRVVIMSNKLIVYWILYYKIYSCNCKFKCIVNCDMYILYYNIMNKLNVYYDRCELWCLLFKLVHRWLATMYLLITIWEFAYTFFYTLITWSFLPHLKYLVPEINILY